MPYATVIHASRWPWSRPSHVPEDREAVENVGDIPAVDARVVVRPERNVGHVHEGLGLYLRRDLLLPGEVGRVEPGLTQLFEPRAGRPAENSLLAVSAQQATRRREEVAGDIERAERIPAAFGRRLHADAALHQRAEVDRLVVDIHARALHHVGDDVACRFWGWEV